MNNKENKKNPSNEFIEGTFSIYSDRNAGFHLKGAIFDAKKSIIIVSPYLTIIDDFLLNSLIAKAKKGTKVHLITSPDFYKKEAHYSLQQRLVQILYFHLAPFRERLVRKTPWLSKKITNWMFYRKIDHDDIYKNFIYRITEKYMDIPSQKSKYRLIPNLKITMTLPSYFYKNQEEDNTKHKRKNLPPKVHSKIYIIDDEIAFTGSLNMTHTGFHKNHETCLKTTSADVISYLKKKALRIENLYSSYYKEHEHHNHLYYTILEKEAPFIYHQRKKNYKKKHK